MFATTSNIIKLYDFPQANLLNSYQPKTEEVGPLQDISWSRDGNWLTVCPSSGPLEIMSVRETLKLVHTVHAVEEPTCSAFQNSTKKYLAIGTKNGLVLVYDIKSKGVKTRFPRLSTSVCRVDYLAKDRHVAAACINGDLLLFSSITNGLSVSVRIPNSSCLTALKASPFKQNVVAAASQEGVIAVWDVHSNRFKWALDAHKAPVTAIAFSPVNSDLLLSTAMDRQFCFYDISTRKCIAAVSVDNCITAADFSADGNHVILGSQRGRIAIYDSRTMKTPLNSFASHTSRVTHVAFQRKDGSDTENWNTSTIDSPLVLNANKRPSSSNYSMGNESMALIVTSPTVTDGTNKDSAINRRDDSQDSFLVALGIGGSDSGNITTNVSTRTTDNKGTSSLQTPALRRLREGLSSQGVLTNSTPLLQNQASIEASSQLSPIMSMPSSLNQVEAPPDTTLENISIQQVQLGQKMKQIEQRMTEMSDKLTNDIQSLRFLMLDHFSNIRQMLLGQHMLTVREFIRAEESLNALSSAILEPQNEQTGNS